MITEQQKARCLMAAITIRRKSKRGDYHKLTDEEFDAEVAKMKPLEVAALARFKQKVEARNAHLLALCDEVLAKRQ